MSVLLRVGCYGWQWPQWAGKFYPEDLPEDWQLDFYANYFRTVLVPQNQWLQWDSEVCEERIESVSLDEDDFDDQDAYIDQPPFLFYLSVEQALTASETQQLQQVMQLLGGYCGGMVKSAALTHVESDLYKQACEGRAAWLGIYPVELTDAKAQGEWAKAFAKQIGQIELETGIVELPVFVGREGENFKAPEKAEQAQSLKLLFEMLT